MLHRTIGNAILGKATPLQLAIACVIGSILGFLPSISNAPASVFILLAILLIFQANLGFTILISGVCKLISLIIAPITFKLGVFLLEGPLQGLFSSLINGPGFALMGFDYYLNTGSWAMGTAFGLVIGHFVYRAVVSIRTTIANFGENSEALKKWSQNFWAKSFTFLMLGTDLNAIGQPVVSKNPFRISGIVVVLALSAGLYFSTPFLESMVTKQMHSMLETGNQATVDVENIKLSLKEGQLSFENIAFCNPDQLTHDRFRAGKLTMQINTKDLLRKRIVLDQVEASHAAINAVRDQPGVYKGIEQKPIEIPLEDLTYENIDKYLTKAKEIRERLHQLKNMLEELSQPEEEEIAPESFEAWLEAEIAKKGYAGVSAKHLIQGTPALLIKNFKADGVTNQFLDDETLNITATHLSTHPSMVAQTPTVTIVSSNKTLESHLALALNSASGQESKVAVSYKGYPMDKATAQLKQDYLKGGHLDFSLKGELKANTWIDLPLNVTLNKTTMNLPNIGEVPLEKFPITIYLKGPIDNPKIKLDKDAFLEALKKNGLQAIAQKYLNQYKAELNTKVEEVKAEVNAKVEEAKAEVNAKVEEAKAEVNTKVEESKAELEAKANEKKEELKTQTQEQLDKEKEKLGGQLKDKLGGLFGKKKEKKEEKEEKEEKEGETEQENQ